MFLQCDLVDRQHGWIRWLGMSTASFGGLFDLYDVENRREVLEGLRIMESAT